MYKNANIMRSLKEAKFLSRSAITTVLRTIMTNPIVCTNKSQCKEKDVIGPQGKKISPQRQAGEILERIIGVRKLHAMKIVEKHRCLIRARADCIASNYSLCRNSGIEHETVLQYPYILSEGNLADKIDLLKHRIDLNKAAPMLNIGVRALADFLSCPDPMYSERIAFLGEAFDQPEEVIYECISKKPFLLKVDLNRIDRIVDVLLAFGITKNEIFNDLHILMYNPETIRWRLNAMKEYNLDKLKTWMVRAPDGVFDKYLQRKTENKLVLGNHSLIEYLSEHLDCTPEQIKYMISKHPAIKTKNLKKIQEIIDFLYSEGFKPIHITRVPKILLHGIETMKQRLKEISDQGLHLDSLYPLTKSQKQYQQIFEALLKAKKK